jgi:predicted NAD/FAD-binding protein
MNRLQSLESARRYLVTLNRTGAIDPERVIRKIDYSHPVFTRAGIGAQRRWEEISGVDRVHFCGAYWRWGFHEDGAWSALRVSAALGGRGPGLEPTATAAGTAAERGPEPLLEAA